MWEWMKKHAAGIKEAALALWHADDPYYCPECEEIDQKVGLMGQRPIPRRRSGAPKVARRCGKHRPL